MLKRVFDLFFSIIGLIALSPLFILVGLSQKLTSKGPIIFKQKRVGRNNQVFKILKFRTMKVGSEQFGKITTSKDERVTRFGRFLRKYKLDELPQLINVMCGDMSFVGPRPEVPEFLDAYTAEERKKLLSVKPGITDFASLEMINEEGILAEYKDANDGYIKEILPIKKRLYFDYIDQQNIILDIQIILKTLIRIFLRKK